MGYGFAASARALSLRSPSCGGISTCATAVAARLPRRTIAAVGLAAAGKRCSPLRGRALPEDGSTQSPKERAAEGQKLQQQAAGADAGKMLAAPPMRALMLKPSSSSTPPPSPPQPPNPLRYLLSMLEGWAAWLRALLVKTSKDPNTVTVLRLLAISGGCFAVGLVRGVLLAKAPAAPQEVLYSTLVTLIDDGKVRSARLQGDTDRLYFDLKPSTTAEQGGPGAVPEASSSSTGVPAHHTVHLHQRFYVKTVEKSDPYLVSRLLAAGVEFSILKLSFQASIVKIFIAAICVWLPLTPLFFIMRRMLGDPSSVGKNKQSSSVAETSSITFADVAGVDGAKLELMEVVGVMKAAKANYSKLKVKMPSGVLLCGPPGTGKTLLAKAVAGEAGIPFLSVSASEFVEMYVGRGAARVRELFAEARKVAPCVVFIDELDAVGGQRRMGHNDERDQTLNQLLVELDGFEGRSGVLFLAATNRINVLDPALLRPGRISRKVIVPLPDEAGRRDILQVHLRGVPILLDEETPMAVQMAVQRLASVTAGLSGAELANVVNEASLMAARKDREHVTMVDLLDGLRRTRGGVDGRTGAGPRNGLLSRLDDFLAAAAVMGMPTDRPRVVKTATS